MVLVHAAMAWMQHTIILTPADQRHANVECLGDETKHEHQFPKHEHSLCSHPEDAGEGEVVREGREDGARYGDILGLNFSIVDDDLASKGEQEEDQGDAELDTELGAVSPAKFAACGERGGEGERLGKQMRSLEQRWYIYMYVCRRITERLL